MGSGGDGDDEGEDRAELSDDREDRPAGGDGQARRDRRRCRRFRVELAITVHLGGWHDPVAAQIIDIGAQGVRFRARAPLSPRVVLEAGGRVDLRVEQEASFGFVSGEQHVCVANGRVLRIGQDANGDGEFVLSIERANAGFQQFVAALVDS